MVLASIADDITDAVGGELPLNTGNKTDWAALNSIRQIERYATGRLSLPMSAIKALKTQKDFNGDPYWEEDMDPTIVDYLTQGALRAFVFLSVQQYLEDRRKNELTEFSIIKYGLGTALYPVDQVQTRAEDALITSLAEEIHLVTDGLVTGSAAKELARTAATERNTAFGNRRRPDKIADPTNLGFLLDLNMERVYSRMAMSQNWWVDTEAGGEIFRHPDTERARLQGRSDDMSPKEKKAFLKAQRDSAFEGIERTKKDIINQTDWLETKYGAGKEYPTIGSALKQVGRLMAFHSAGNRSLRRAYGFTLDMLRDKRVVETKKDRAFDVVRLALETTTNEDGTVDHWNRTRMLDELELKFEDTPLMDEFFTHEDLLGESWLLKTWRAATAAASEFYSVPASILTEEEFALWRQLTVVRGNQREEFDWEQQVGSDTWARADKLTVKIDNARFLALQEQDVKTPGTPELIAQEVALWLLDGRTPQNSATLKLFKYHTGVEFPSATQFVGAITEDGTDTDLLLSILEGS